MNTRRSISPLIIVSIAFSLALMLPVLLSPHFGLFSDAQQLINLPSFVINNFPQSMDSFLPLSDGRWNPAFHMLSIALYAISPGNPLVFYIAQWIMLAVTLICAGAIVLRISDRYIYSFIAIAIFGTCASLFENFYTLDKVEPRVTVFAALSALLFLVRMTERAAFRPSTPIYVGLQFILGVLVVFSKETGAFLAISYGAMLGVSYVFRLDQKLRRDILATATPHVIVLILYITLFRMLMGDSDYRYISYSVSSDLIIRNLYYYFASSPELAVAVCFAVFNLVKFVLRPGIERNPDVTFVAWASGALVTFFMGIALWRWPLDYYLLPAHFFAAIIIGSGLYSAVSRGWSRPLIFVVASVLAVGWSGMFLYRVAGGVAIYAVDASKDRLAAFLAAPEFRGKRIVLPFSSPESFEVGARLKFFIADARPDKQAPDLFNFWEPPGADKQNLERFAGIATQPPPIELLELAAATPNRFALWERNERDGSDDQNSSVSAAGREIDPIWRLDFLKKGDLILVATGEPLVRKFNARGVTMHAQDEAIALSTIPLDLQKLGIVQGGIGPVQLGWSVFEVMSDDLDNVDGYSISALRALNRPDDVAYNRSGLYQAGVTEVTGVYLGIGWYDLIQPADGSAFRWMREKGELLLIDPPAGRCSFDVDVEPVQLPGSPPVVLSSSGAELSSYKLTQRQLVTITTVTTGNGDVSIALHATGGPDDIPGDSRQLKLRIFGVTQMDCK